MSTYNKAVLKVAARKSFFHISWLVLLIGIPIIFFAHGLSLIEGALLLAGLLIFFWGVYFSLCLVFHRLSLRDCDVRSDYMAKSDIEKGEEVGSKLEGW
ncbi:MULTISPECIES: hypothetical protein [unclassified Pseudoalteromonas]|uniref:hypothetical protein n=1 Tax=unclassified Pseudoalteromonas TaxID=194690 RepID=UPI00257410FB|nr:hypothetical protein [Pseudoalteromonas sp. MM1]BED91132.1 hypothetical protein PspMM1_36000 [Pseudoalteromonas sp. MM1]